MDAVLNAILAVIGMALMVAVGLFVIMYFKTTRDFFGLGAVAPTGLVAKLGAK